MTPIYTLRLVWVTPTEKRHHVNLSDDCTILNNLIFVINK